MASDESIISEAKEAYRLGIEQEDHNRQSYLEDYRFSRLNEQWPTDMLDKRTKQGRPSLVIPKLSAFIRQVVNDARQNRPQIVTKPVDGLADPKTASVLDGLVRHIQVRSNADIAYDTGIDCAVSGGFGYWTVDVEYADGMSMDKEIRINPVSNPLSIVGDPYSQRSDSSDWNSAFQTTMIPEDKFEELYKGAARTNWEAEYKDCGEQWRDGEDIMVAKWWTREEIDKTVYKLSDGRVVDDAFMEQQGEMLAATGTRVVGSRQTKGYKVRQRILTGVEVIEEKPWSGQYIPIIPIYGEELNIEGKRYFMSLIHSAKDAQRRYNYWASAATELVALAPKTPFIGEAKAFEEEPHKWDTINTESWAYIATPNGITPPQRQPLDGGQAVGAISQAMAASDEIKAILGMYDASLGQKSNETSGKAIMARQREGDTATFHFVDNQARAVRHTGCVIVDLAPSVYPPGSVVRILGERDMEATVTLGNADPQAPKPAASPLDEQDVIQEAGGLPDIYDIGLGRYDVTVDTGPSYNSKREQTSYEMTEFIRAFPDAAPVIGDIFAKNQDWQGADEIGRRLKAMLPSQIAGGPSPEVQQLQQQLEQVTTQAEQAVQELQAQLEQANADKETEQAKINIERMKLEVERYRAETERMKMESDARIAAIQAMNPPQPNFPEQRAS